MKASQFLSAATLFAMPLLHGCPSAPQAQATAQASAAAQATARPKPLVSGANFVSLEWKRAGGVASAPIQVLFRKESVSLHRGGPFDRGATQKKALSQSEMDSLLKLLNEAPFARAVGRSKMPVPPDAFSNEVILTLREPGKKPRTLVADYHQADPRPAPRAFGKVVSGLSALRNKKFPNAQKQ